MRPGDGPVLQLCLIKCHTPKETEKAAKRVLEEPKKARKGDVYFITGGGD